MKKPHAMRHNGHSDDLTYFIQTPFSWGFFADTRSWVLDPRCNNIAHWMRQPLLAVRADHEPEAIRGH